MHGFESKSIYLPLRDYLWQLSSSSQQVIKHSSPDAMDENPNLELILKERVLWTLSRDRSK
jgi:hypothetical protein